MTTINIFITCGPGDKISIKRTKVEKPHAVQTQNIRRYSETENHILEIVAGMPDVSAMGREKFIMLCAETLPAPAEGERDSRMVRASAAVTDMCKGKDAPFREIDGVVHFLVG